MKSQRRGLGVSFVFSLLILAHPAQANPEGGTVVGGAARIDRMPGRLTINQGSDRLIINWRSFSIGAGETTKFVQPSASSAALNRVMSGDPSRIYGNLEANGRVFLINPNGVLVGKGATVTTRGFVASTLDVSDASFLSGAKLTLSGDSTAAVVNEGAIEAIGGDVFLIGRTVENSGSIRAASGTVGLAAGSEVVIVPTGRERVSVIAGNADGAPAGTGVKNIGTIEAVSAELKAAGGNIYALAINNGGIIRATGVERRGGRVYLTSDGGNIENSGTISAKNANGSGGTVFLAGGHNADNPATVINTGTIEARGDSAGTRGGEVRLTGDYVGLFGAALIDVSGHSGGGTVLVGGDYHGDNPLVQNALRVGVGADAEIRADALVRGDGGRVIVWSDESTRYHGAISARGGVEGGNGGFVEISSGLNLVAQGTINLTAPRGLTGTLLYDPLDIVIQGGTGDGDDTEGGNSSVLLDQAADPDGTILFGAEGTLTPVPFVIRESEIEGTDANITLEARNSITVSGTFNNDADGGGGTLDPGANVVLLQADRNLVLRTRNDTGDDTGSIIPSGIDLTASGSLNDLEFRTQGTGTILIETGSGAATPTAAPITVGKLTTAAGGITVASQGALTVNGALTTGDLPASTSDQTSGSINLSSAQGSVNINASVTTGDVTITDEGGGGPGAIEDGATGGISIIAFGGIDLDILGSLTTGNVLWGGADDGADTATSGNITLTAGAAGAVVLDGNVTTGNATVGNGNGGDDALTGKIEVTAGGSITTSGRLITGNAAAVEGGDSGDGSDTATSGLISLTAGAAGSVVINDDSTPGAELQTGTANLRDSGSDSDTATTGKISLTAGAGVSGTGRSLTGNATLRGVDNDANGETVASGLVEVTAGAGGIGLSATDALRTGDALRIDAALANLDADIRQSGNIVLDSVGDVNNGTAGSPLSVRVGDTPLDNSDQGAVDVTPTTPGGDVFLTSSTTLRVGTVNMGAVGAGDISLIADEIDFVGGNNSVQGGGTLTLRPADSTLAIVVGDANDSGAPLDITGTDLDALADGFSGITIGDAVNGSGTVTVEGPAAFDDSVRLVGSSIVLNDTLTSSGAGNVVTLTARTGSITEDSDPAADVVADALSATAQTGINLDTTITTLTLASVLGTGAIDISDTAGGLNVTDASAVDGNITLNATGGNLGVGTVTASGRTVTLTSGGAITDGNAGAVNVVAADLSATAQSGIDLDTTIGTLTLASVLNTGDINISDSADGLIVTSASTANGGNVILAAAGGLLNVVSATAGGNGDIQLSTTGSGDVNVGTLTADGSTVTINSAAAITDGNAGAANVVADALSATAQTGIDLDTTIATLTLASVLGIGAIDISDTAGGLAVTLASTFDGAITLNATGGDLDVVSATANGTGRNISLNTTTSGDVKVGNVTAADDTVTVVAAGAIEELGPVDVEADITAATISLTAATGIGAAGTLEIDATTLSVANVTGTGGIDLSDTLGGLAVTAATTANGDITLNATGGNLDVALATANGTSRDITLSTTTSGDVNVGNVTASGDSVTVTSAGAVEELGPVDAAPDITADSISLTAGTGIGLAGVLELDATTLSASSGGAVGQNIVITDTAGGVQVGTINAGAANVSLTATDGSITSGADNNVADIVGATINLTIVETAPGNHTIGENAGDRLEVDATTALNAQTQGNSSGDGIFLTDTAGGVEVGAINAGLGQGDVMLTARGGSITSGADDNVADITGANVSLTVVETAAGEFTIGEGAADRLEVSASTLTAQTEGNSAGDAIFLSALGGLTGLNLNSALAGIDLLAAGSVTDTDGAVDLTAQSISFTVTGSGNDIGSSANTIGIGGTGGGVTLDAAGGGVHVRAQSGGGTDVNFTDSGEVVNTTYVSTKFDQGGRTYEARYHSGAQGDLTVQSDGNITADAGIAVTVPTATLNLRAAGSIGGGFTAPLRMDAGTFSGSAANGIAVHDPGTLTLGQISTDTGDFLVRVGVTMVLNGQTSLSAGSGYVVLVADGKDKTPPGVSVSGSPTIDPDSEFILYAFNPRFTDPPAVRNQSDQPTIGGLIADKVDEGQFDPNLPFGAGEVLKDGQSHFVFFEEADVPTDPSLFIDIPMELYRPVSINFGEYDPTKFGEVGDLWMSSSELYEMERKAGKAPKAVPEKVDKSKYVAESK